MCVVAVDESDGRRAEAAVSSEQVKDDAHGRASQLYSLMDIYAYSLTYDLRAQRRGETRSESARGARASCAKKTNLT